MLVADISGPKRQIITVMPTTPTHATFLHTRMDQACHPSWPVFYSECVSLLSLEFSPQRLAHCWMPAGCWDLGQSGGCWELIGREERRDREWISFSTSQQDEGKNHTEHYPSHVSTWENQSPSLWLGKICLLSHTSGSLLQKCANVTAIGKTTPPLQRCPRPHLWNLGSCCLAWQKGFCRCDWAKGLEITRHKDQRGRGLSNEVEVGVMGPQAREGEALLEAGKAKETDGPLEALEGAQLGWHLTLSSLTPISYFLSLTVRG